MDEHREDRHLAATRNRRRSCKGIGRLPEKVNNNAIAQRRILIADEPNDPSLVDHAEHLAHARTIGDVYPDERTILIDEAIHPRRALPLRHAHQRKARRGECTAHEFPVAAVRGRKDRPAPFLDNCTQFFHCARERDVVAHVQLHNGIAQHLHQHRTEAQTARTSNALRLCIRNAKAAHDLLPCECLTPCRDKDPREPRQPLPERHRSTVRQETDQTAEELHRSIGKHLSPSHAVPQALFRGILFFSPSRADGGSPPARAATPYAAARGSPHRTRPRAYPR